MLRYESLSPGGPIPLSGANGSGAPYGSVSYNTLDPPGSGGKNRDQGSDPNGPKVTPKTPKVTPWGPKSSPLDSWTHLAPDGPILSPNGAMATPNNQYLMFSGPDFGHVSDTNQSDLILSSQNLILSSQNLILSPQNLILGSQNFIWDDFPTLKPSQSLAYARRGFFFQKNNTPLEKVCFLMKLG